MKLNALRSRMLFALILCLCAAGPVLPGGLLGESLVRIMGWVAVLGALFAASSRRSELLAATIIATLAVLCESLAFLLQQEWLYETFLFVEAGFYFYVSFVLLGYTLRSKTIDPEHMFAAVCAYLLIGVAFAFLYTGILVTAPGALAGEPLRDLAFASSTHSVTFEVMLYYSFATLSTLGYGDIVPTLPPVMMLSAFQATLGQLYLTVIIAWLVGMHLHQRGSKTS